jgi:hypothetical protein
MNRLFATTTKLGSNPTADKISSFSSLKSGWRFGEGSAFECQTILNAIKLLNAGLLAGFQQTDAFPGKEGDVAVAFYRGTSRYEFTVSGLGLVSFLHETDTQEYSYEEDLSLNEAITKIETLGLWNLYFFYTSPTMTKLVGGSEVRSSENQAVNSGEEFLWSNGIARWIKVIRSASTFEDTIPGSLMNRQSFGFSIHQYYQGRA